MKNLGKFIITAIVAVVCGGACMACYSSKDLKGDDQKVEINRRVGYFSKIESFTSADIKFVQGKSSSVRIVGSKSLVDNLSVETSGDMLVLKTKGNNNFRNFNFGNMSKRSLTVYVTSPDLTSINLRGSGDFSADSNIDTDELIVSISGSGDVDLNNVICDKMIGNMSGSGDFEAKTIDSKSFILSMNGSGDAEFGTVKAGKAVVAVRGSGDVSTSLRGVDDTVIAVYGSGDANVRFDNCGDAVCNVHGSGDMTLSGSLKNLSRSKLGSGDINMGRLSVSGNRTIVNRSSKEIRY